MEGEGTVVFKWMRTVSVVGFFVTAVVPNCEQDKFAIPGGMGLKPRRVELLKKNQHRCWDRLSPCAFRWSHLRRQFSSEAVPSRATRMWNGWSVCE